MPVTPPNPGEAPSQQERQHQADQETELQKLGDLPGLKEDELKEVTDDGKVLDQSAAEIAKNLGKILTMKTDDLIAGYRDRSIDFVKDFAKSLEVEHQIFSFENELDVSIDRLMKNDPSAKSCTYCGVFRRTLINKAGREVGADKVAVGHNLDDEAQSVLMNVMRGDMKRMSRLAKSSPSFVRRIKPLKNIPEKEIVAYAVINSIPYFDGECPNSFNNARRDVQTLLNEMERKYPGTKNNIINFYRKLPAIPIETSPVVCAKCGEPSSHEVCKACELAEKARK